MLDRKVWHSFSSVDARSKRPRNEWMNFLFSCVIFSAFICFSLWQAVLRRNGCKAKLSKLVYELYNVHRFRILLASTNNVLSSIGDNFVLFCSATIKISYRFNSMNSPGFIFTRAFTNLIVAIMTSQRNLTLA